MILAGFFTSFLLYLALGLLALLATAVLDKLLGKERGLLVYALAILGLTWAIRPTPPAPESPRPKPLKLEHVDPTTLLAPVGEVFSREPLPRDVRNAFMEQSDTNALPPERLTPPPGVALPFPLAPTIPCAGPEARRVYRGTLPSLKLGDGSKLPDVPVDSFSAYQPKPEDVFDWVMQAGQRYYVYIREIDDAKEEKKEDQVAFHSAKGLKWNLALQEGPPNFPKEWKTLRVTIAAIGPEDQAKKLVSTVRKARNLNVTTISADQHERWFLRRTVENAFVEECRKNGSPNPADLSVDGLKLVAAEMGKLGDAGKEDGKGWAKAIEVLELALAKCEQPPHRDATDVLLALIEAYRATHDQPRMLATLSRYVEATQGGTGQADGATWLGDVYLQRLKLPERAEALYTRALSAQAGAKNALVGRGEARALRGDWRGALADFKAAGEAGGRGETAVLEAEALLGLGRLAEAKTAVDTALSANAFDPRALLAKGAIQYASGDVQGARDTFAQATALPGEGLAGVPARRHRAEALYDLGLAEWRLGHADAASGAFDAAEKSLRTGASLGRSPDETVSPDLGRALVQLSQGNQGEAVDALEHAREHASGIAYVEMLAGWIARQQGDATKALSRFQASLALAPTLSELDPWLSETLLAVAEGAVAEGKPAAESAVDFDAAVAFAVRAARREAQADPKNTDYAVREALARLAQQDLSERRRFESAKAAAAAILERVREERRALAIEGYCNYRLGIFDSALYDQCLRDFQRILDVPAAEGDVVKAYAQECRDKIVHWMSLEEKLVSFSDPKLTSEWSTMENQGIRVGPDDGWLVFKDISKSGANQDGSPQDPTVVAKAKKLFTKDTLEVFQAWVAIPKTDAQGNLVNNLTFGFAIQPATGDAKALAKNQGIGIFYDKGFVSVRVGGGSDPAYKDGELHRVMKDGKAVEWPDDPTGLGVLVEIERRDKDGNIVVRLGSQEILKDRLPAFKRTKGDAELWIGGWSNKATIWDIKIDKLRIERKRS